MQIDNYNLKNLLIWAYNLFIHHKLYFGHGSINAWDEAVFIASFVLKLNLYKVKLTDQLLTKSQGDLFVKIASLRASKKIPLPYITNTAWFAGKPYYVDRRVIIPRSPFAELIAKRFKPWLKCNHIVPNGALKILDLCTGSGCIAIACYHEFIAAYPSLTIDAIDISRNALTVANKNLQLHKIPAGKINLIQSDLFADIYNWHVHNAYHNEKPNKINCHVNGNKKSNKINCHVNGNKKPNKINYFANSNAINCNQNNHQIINLAIKYDLIISNPPYVDAKTFHQLPKEFHFEPKLAFVSKHKGLEIVVKILTQANKFLTKYGILIVEVGSSWQQLIKALPTLHVTWIKLKHGGEGIFVITKQQLDNYFTRN